MILKEQETKIKQIEDIQMAKKRGVKAIKKEIVNVQKIANSDKEKRKVDLKNKVREDEAHLSHYLAQEYREKEKERIEREQLELQRLEAKKI